MADKNRRRISMLVTAQTDYNLKKLAYMLEQEDDDGKSKLG